MDIGDAPQPGTPQGLDDAATVQKIQGLLKTKNDTSRFVGLALLKTVLDNSQQLREDEATITALWQSVSPKFLDRLLRSGSGVGSSPASKRDANDMVSIAVAVLHTFSTLLPPPVKQESSLVDRIPPLVSVILHSSDDTTQLILQALLTLVNSPAGASKFIAIDDLSCLIEIAPAQPLVLDVLLDAFTQSAVTLSDTSSLSSKIDSTTRALAVSFKGTDGVTLLSFVDRLLRRLDPEILPKRSSWIKPITTFVRNLVSSKPTAAGRDAYTNLIASLLQSIPGEASKLLFSDAAKPDKPFSYLLMNLVLIDLRSSFPVLLEQLNSPAYEDNARRLASAFDIVSAFIGYLVKVLEDEDADESLSARIMAPDLLLKLRKSISETLSLSIEYLRDRWDASVAGAMGLHPDARVRKAKTSTGSRHTLAWDSKTERAEEDPLILAAIRSLAIWLREDDNDMLRMEAAGLSDMFMDLYQSSTSDRLDFKMPVLVALEGIVAVEEGASALLENGGWDTLAKDILSILLATSSEGHVSEAARGIDIVRVLLQIVECEEPGSRESWMTIVTAVAAWNVPDAEQTPTMLEFQVAVLQLVTALLSNTHSGMQRRYQYSISAILGIVEQMRDRVGGDEALVEALDDVDGTLRPFGA
ncbi:Neurochondrin-domain-containing protein [Coniella lustricola]|uniref:Neurochondrin-domain-containing protein n=1 Tax=Coniella lustricola TaxID=2025994 RepID=A0A2T3AFL0_9PEZI|nr:Neurochondrin-domain-containing protein [Coniella lustricola]